MLLSPVDDLLLPTIVEVEEICSYPNLAVELMFDTFHGLSLAAGVVPSQLLPQQLTDKLKWIEQALRSCSLLNAFPTQTPVLLPHRHSGS